MKHTGSCHCGAVKFEADIDVAAGATRCNCSICVRVAQSSSIIKPSAFKLLAGEGGMGMYEWGMKVGKRYFCKTCGVHCFGTGHLEQLGGDYVSVNWNCIDDIDVGQVKIGYWDGRHNNWMAGLRDKPWPVNAA